MNDLVGQRLGNYQVLRRLGSGGMADVYAARELTLQRDVALKVLRDETRRSDEDLKRFRREAQAAARLNHVAIVQVYEIGDADGHHFIAQELIDGQNLAQRLSANGPLHADEAVTILRQVAMALQVAHDAGVTHRDIKPENIMRGDEGTIKVTDFGLARMLATTDASTANLTRDGLTLGTPRYMSPEQIQGHAVDGRSDLYSLGVTMFHLLSGSPPFDADEPLALAVKHLHETPPPLDRQRGRSDLPTWLVATVMRLLQKAPADRFQTAAELCLWIDRCTAKAPGIEETGIEEKAVASSGNDSNGIHSSGTHSPSVVSGKRELVPPNETLASMSATVRLQRITDASASHRTGLRRWVTWLVAAVAGGLLGGVVVARTQNPTIAPWLRGNTVPQAESIELQYLTALTRGDVDGWKSVVEYFPLDETADRSQIRTDYHHKSKLQLARLFLEQKNFYEARQTLETLMRSPSLSRLHQCLALTLRYQLAVATQDEPDQTNVRTRLLRSITELETANPASMETYNRVTLDSLRSELGIVVK